MLLELAVDLLLRRCDSLAFGEHEHRALDLFAVVVEPAERHGHEPPDERGRGLGVFHFRAGNLDGPVLALRDEDRRIERRLPRGAPARAALRIHVMPRVMIQNDGRPKRGGDHVARPEHAAHVAGGVLVAGHVIVNRVNDDALHVAGRELAHCAEYLRRGVRAVEVERLVADEELVEVGAPVQPRPRCDALPESEVTFAAEVDDDALLCPPPVPVEPRCDAARHVEGDECFSRAGLAEDHRDARLGHPALDEPAKRRRLGEERRRAG